MEPVGPVRCDLDSILVGRNKNSCLLSGRWLDGIDSGNKYCSQHDSIWLRFYHAVSAIPDNSSRTVPRGMPWICVSKLLSERVELDRRFRVAKCARHTLTLPLDFSSICPWKILVSASVFTTFLAGYGLFMASVSKKDEWKDLPRTKTPRGKCLRRMLTLPPVGFQVVAIMIADYWLLTKGNVFVSYLYVSSLQIVACKKASRPNIY